MDHVLDIESFIKARETFNPYTRPFLEIFLRQPISAYYITSRFTATDLDALDQAHHDSDYRKAIEASLHSLRRVEVLGEAWKAKVDTHSHSFFGPTSWKRRRFEIHHLAPGDSPSADGQGQDEPEVLNMHYFEVDNKLAKLEGDLQSKKMLEKSTRNKQLIKKLHREIFEIDQEIAQRQFRAEKGIFALIKGKTTFQIPDTARRKFHTVWAFELHVHHGRKTKVITIACDRSKDRKHFIETIKRALLTKAEVQRMREQFLAPDVVRELHRRMKHTQLTYTTRRIIQSFPAPFLASRSTGRKPSNSRLDQVSSSANGRAVQGATENTPSPVRAGSSGHIGNQQQPSVKAQGADPSGVDEDVHARQGSAEGVSQSSSFSGLAASTSSTTGTRPAWSNFADEPANPPRQGTASAAAVQNGPVDEGEGRCSMS